HTETLAFRAERNEVIPVELRTREGLITHLEALQTESHPGAALNRFAESFDATSADVVLITGADVLADAEFRRSLHESDLNSAYLASVSRDGLFELSMYSPRGEKPLKRAILDVDKLLETPPRPATPLIDPGRSIEYPAILRVTPFPLRMSHPDRHPATWHVQDYGSLVLTYDGRLMKWDDGKRGAIQLTDTAPRGDLLWWDVSRSGEEMRAAIGKQHTGKMWLLTLNLDDDAFSFATIDLQHPYFLRIVEHGGALFVIRQGGMVDVHSLADGSHLKTMTVPGYHTLRDGRFFSTHDAWWALSYDGLTAHLEEVPVDKKSYSEILTVFDCEDAHGPVALLKDGSFYFTHNQTSWLPKHLLPSIDSYHLSRTGRRVLLKSKTLRSGVMQFGGSTIDLRTREVLSMYHLSQADTPPEYRQLPMRSLRTRFLSIGILDNSTLVLTNRRGTQWKIEPRVSHNEENIRTELAGLSPKEKIRVGMEHAGRQALNKQLKLVMIDGAETARVRSQRSFEQMRSPGGVGFRLHQAVWEDGSRAILDSRGMLHLKSSDRSIPEATLVLSEPEV
ncbi:MAG: hypothetical protein KDA52_22190, partial [Planctomycetaceae bacterium]|nr:hypothetical protein [Planctomycetaceae bacterium]